MIIIIEKLKNKWLEEKLYFEQPLKKTDIVQFETTNKVLLPNDLKDYFSSINGTNSNYDNDFFCFYSIKNFKSVNEVYKDWTGNPNYSDFLKTPINKDNLFVFADYMINTFSYVITLNQELEVVNPIYVVCGDEYKLVANSFTEFITKYLEDTILIQF
jgi:hypothetical protein